MKEAGRSDLVSMGALGMLSGAIAWGLITLSDNSQLSTIRGGAELGIVEFRVFPGLVYGLLIGLVWHRRGGLSQRGVPAYAIAATVAHFLAFEVALHTFDAWPGISETVALALSGILAGFIGCCILGLATARLLRLPPRAVLGLPVLAGTALGVLLPLVNLSGDSKGIGWLVFYMVWQGGYAAGSARLVHAHAAAHAHTG